MESLSGRLLLLHLETGQMPGMVLHWQGEQDRSGWIRVIKEYTKTLDQKIKLYLIYKGQRPSAKNMQDLREELRCEVIPITSFRLEKSMLTQNNKGRLEELKEMEEPFLTRIDPYAESRPIHDPTWFYGRDEFMKRIPADLAQGQHVGVFGLRKVGKTSLIQQIQQRFVYTPTVYIDCQAFFPKAEIYFEEILRQLNTELGKLGVKGLPEFKSLGSTEDFQKTFLFMYEKWKQSGHLGPFLIIMDEIDKFFPDLKMRDSESILSEYVCFFKVLRGLAQSHQCLVTMVIAYRPDVNRKNLLSPSIGENPMFKSFLEEYLGFLAPLESTAMIQEIGGWKDIRWEKDAAQRAFYYCGGHPLITRYFASDACMKGTLKYVDHKRVEDTAEKIQKTFHKNDIGNYYNEGVWALMSEDEQKVISLICQGEGQGISEVQIPVDLENALTNLEQFGLIENRQGRLCFTARLFDKWLQRRFTYESV